MCIRDSALVASCGAETQAVAGRYAGAVEAALAVLEGKNGVAVSRVAVTKRLMKLLSGKVDGLGGLVVASVGLTALRAVPFFVSRQVRGSGLSFICAVASRRGGERPIGFRAEGTGRW